MFCFLRLNTGMSKLYVLANTRILLSQLCNVKRKPGKRNKIKLFNK